MALVLLVHDDIALIAAAKRLLSRAGHDVILATSVADANIAFGHHLPELVVLGPSLEGGRGRAVLEELKDQPEIMRSRLVLLGEEVEGFRSAVVPLPLDGALFMETVAALLDAPPSKETWLERTAAEVAAPALAASPGSWEPPASVVAPAARHEPHESVAWPEPAPEAMDVGPKPPEPPKLGSLKLKARIQAMDAGLEGAIPAQARVGLEELCRMALKLTEARLSGRWELRADEAIRELWFHEGELLAAASNRMSESLAERAHRDGLLDASQLKALQRERGSDRQLLSAMLDRGLLREKEAVPLLQRFTEQIALEALSEELSTVRWSQGAEPEEAARAAPPRPFRALVLEGLRRGLHPEVVAVRTRGLLGAPGWLLRPPDLVEAGWTDREVRVLSAVDGETTVQGLLLGAGVRQEVGLKALAMAEALGLLEIRPPPDTGARSPSPELEAERLNAKWQAVEDADYFQVLGLPRTCGADEVQRACRALSEEFHPLRYVGHPDPGLQTRAQRLVELFAEAASALQSDSLRQSYARNLLG